MFDYGKQLAEYHDVAVNLPEAIRQKLRDHRKANQDRIIANMPSDISVSRSSFVAQGSYAMKTTIQEENNAYDIDDGLRLRRDELKWAGTLDYPPSHVKSIVRDAVRHSGFNTEPEILPNCVRVYYAEGHHVDIAVYRVYDEEGETVKEVANEGGWTPSDPQRINSWFNGLIENLNAKPNASGTQLRRLIRLLKRFSKSRGKAWDMPSGLKLTMLAVEAYAYAQRDDEAFYSMLQSISDRLATNLIVYNLAGDSDPQPELTRTAMDGNMIVLRDKIAEAVQQLDVVTTAGCTAADAATAWDWVFQSEGFFDAFEKDAARAVDVFEKTALVKAHIALTDATMRIGTVGTPNKEHKFYGEE